jgi:outer membrane lipoprotein SlyB
MKPYLFAVAMAVAAAACTTTNPDVVSRHDAQRMSTVLDGTIVSVRDVVVDGTQSGLGGAAGGVIGGVAGSSLRGNRESAIGGVIGAVVGGVVGNAVERVATKEDAVELIIQLSTGERRAIVQARGGESLNVGDAVMIVTNGGKARVIRAAPPAPRG